MIAPTLTPPIAEYTDDEMADALMLLDPIELATLVQMAYAKTGGLH